MKSNEELQQEFWKFLRRNKVTTQFKKNVSNAIANDNYGNKFEDALNGNIIEEAVNHGFTWTLTTEGQEFWADLSRQWNRHVNKMKGNLFIGGFKVTFNKKGKSISIGCNNVPWETVKNVYEEICRLEK